MRVDFSQQRARVSEKKRRDQLLRVVKAAAGSLAVGAAGLFFGFAMGLHDARWADTLTEVAHASLLFSAQDIRG